MKAILYTLQTLGLKLAARLACALPEKSACALGRLLGNLGYHLARFRRRVALRNVRLALGEHTPSAEADRIVRGAFDNLGRTAVEMFRFARTRPEKLRAIVESDNAGVLDRARAQGKGAILLSAHFGNWELFGAWIAALGHPIDVVVKPQRNRSADEFYNRLRTSMGVGIIPTQKASKQILVSLRQNRLVAILADQYAGQDGVPVEFFGHLTATHRGPAAIALRLRCPILHGVLVRLPNGRHRAVCEGPLEFTPTGVEEDDIRNLTQAYTRILERYIRKHPEQWLWTHRRWKDVR